MNIASPFLQKTGGVIAQQTQPTAPESNQPTAQQTPPAGNDTVEISNTANNENRLSPEEAKQAILDVIAEHFSEGDTRFDGLSVDGVVKRARYTIDAMSVGRNPGRRAAWFKPLYEAVKNYEIAINANNPRPQPAPSAPATESAPEQPQVTPITEADLENLENSTWVDTRHLMARVVRQEHGEAFQQWYQSNPREHAPTPSFSVPGPTLTDRVNWAQDKYREIKGAERHIPALLEKYALLIPINQRLEVLDRQRLEAQAEIVRVVDEHFAGDFADDKSLARGDNDFEKKVNWAENKIHQISTSGRNPTLRVERYQNLRETVRALETIEWGDRFR